MLKSLPKQYQAHVHAFLSEIEFLLNEFAQFAGGSQEAKNTQFILKAVSYSAYVAGVKTTFSDKT